MSETWQPGINLRGVLKPALGVTLNDEAVKRHLKPGTAYFDPTPMWDEPQSWDDALFS